MQVGTMFLGEVETLGDESIQTKFFILGVPLVPLESFYATSSTGHGVRGIPIETHPASVAAGYLRIFMGFAAVGCGFMAWLEWRSYDPQWDFVAGAVVSTVVWVWAMFFLGRLSEAERTRRTRLRLATGIGAPPDLLPTGTREEIRDALLARWTAAGGGDWRVRLQSGEASGAELILLHALAEYDLDRDLARFASMALAA